MKGIFKKGVCLMLSAVMMATVVSSTVFAQGLENNEPITETVGKSNIDEQNFNNEQVVEEPEPGSDDEQAEENTQTQVVEESEPGSDNEQHGGIIEISTLEQLEAFRDGINSGQLLADKNAKLMNDIDIREKNWIPIGTKEHPYKGTFYGNDKQIIGLTIEQTD